MHKVFTIDEGKAKPVDIARITDEHDFSLNWGELNSGLKRAIIDDVEPIPMERLVLAGNPIGITATSFPGGSDISCEALKRNLNGISNKYDEDVVFILGNYSSNPSYYYEIVFPALPIRLNGPRDLPAEYSAVKSRLFRYDMEGRVVSVSPLSGDSTPQCEFVLHKVAKVLKPGEIYEGPKWAMSVGDAGVPYSSNDRYIDSMLPANGVMCISSEELFLLEFPGIYSGYGQDVTFRDGKPIDDSRRNNKISNFLGFAEYGLREHRDKPESERFPVDRIVRIIGDIRGDTCCCFFSYGMFGYTPKE